MENYSIDIIISINRLTETRLLLIIQLHHSEGMTISIYIISDNSAAAWNTVIRAGKINQVLLPDGDIQLQKDVWFDTRQLFRVVENNKDDFNYKSDSKSQHSEVCFHLKNQSPDYYSAGRSGTGFRQKNQPHTLIIRILILFWRLNPFT